MKIHYKTKVVAKFSANFKVKFTEIHSANFKSILWGKNGVNF